MQALLTAFQDYAIYGIAALAFIEAFMVSVLLRRIEKLHRRLDVAARAAEDAAKAAAMAAPGGIDPDVVIALIRSGQPPSLDAVYSLMQRKEMGQ